MTLARLQATFMRLPRHTQLIGIGALILAVSTLFPWYEDRDSYGIGDRFLGVTGPTSFVGIAVLLFAAASLWIFSYHLLERRVPKLPTREGLIHLFIGAEAVFLLLLVNSIFFHPKFGVNILLKESRYGMIIALLGAGILTYGGWRKNKMEREGDDEVGRLEPLIKLDSTTPGVGARDRSHGGVSPARPADAALHASAAHAAGRLTEASPEKSHADPHKNFVFGDTGAAGSPEKSKGQSGSGSSMIRMDL